MRATRRRGWLLLPLALAATAAVPPAAFGFRRAAEGDGRSRGSLPATAAARAEIARNGSAAVRSYAATLGREGIVSLDATTDTPRVVARTDGFLTAKSSKPKARIALDYLRAHLRAFGLTANDLQHAHAAQRLRLDRRHPPPLLRPIAQRHPARQPRPARQRHQERPPDQPARRPHPRPPRHHHHPHPRRLAGPRPRPPRPRRTRPRRDRDARPPRRPTQDPHARRRPGRPRPLPHRHRHPPRLADLRHEPRRQARPRDDRQRDRAVLERRSLSDSANGLAWAYYPGAPRGGTQVSRDFTGRGWLPAGATTLSGNNSHTFGDVNDDNVAQPSEEIRAQAARQLQLPVSRRSALGPPCSTLFPCSWDPSTPFSLADEPPPDRRRRSSSTSTPSTTTWRRAPIGFTEAAGNFQNVNASGQGKGGDAVQTQVDDGANTDPTTPGLPDGNHVDNANMSTPPDGTPPTMQMYLFHFPGTTLAEDPFLAGNGGDDAIIVYHEYTHGLSNRLVVDAARQLDARQPARPARWARPGATGTPSTSSSPRASPRTRRARRARHRTPTSAPASSARPHPAAWTARSATSRCARSAGRRGGYTYGDFGKIIRQPRGPRRRRDLGPDAVGPAHRARLDARPRASSPGRWSCRRPNPSFLDERNAILQADQVVNGGARPHDDLARLRAPRHGLLRRGR